LRNIDDAIDEAESLEAAESVYQTLVANTQKAYTNGNRSPPWYMDSNFLDISWVPSLIPKPFFSEILAGFNTDVEFHRQDIRQESAKMPIQTEEDLLTYCRRVSVFPLLALIYATSDVAEFKECLVDDLFSTQKTTDQDTKDKTYQIIQAIVDLGIGAQLVDIAKDLLQDAREGKVYIPLSWVHTPEEKDFFNALRKNQLDPSMVQTLKRYSSRLFQMANKHYQRGRSILDASPDDTVNQLKFCFERYMASRDDTWVQKGDRIERIRIGPLSGNWAGLKAVYG